MESEERMPELQKLTSEKITSLNDDVIVEPFDRRQMFLPKVKLFLRGNLMLFLTMTGIIVGFALGFGIRELHPSKNALMWIGTQYLIKTNPIFFIENTDFLSMHNCLIYLSCLYKVFSINSSFISNNVDYKL